MVVNGRFKGKERRKGERKRESISSLSLNQSTQASLAFNALVSGQIPSIHTKKAYHSLRCLSLPPRDADADCRVRFESARGCFMQWRQTKHTCRVLSTGTSEDTLDELIRKLASRAMLTVQQYSATRRGIELTKRIQATTLRSTDIAVTASSLSTRCIFVASD